MSTVVVTFTPVTPPGRKRKRDDSKSADDGSDDDAKKPKPSTTSAMISTPIVPFIPNNPPTQILDVIVFGEGAGGEMGLGSKVVNGLSPIEVMSPRMNRLLSGNDVGVVQIACGTMHGIAITRDNQILTWGVNNFGALGRDTNDYEDEDDVLNPSESTPAPIDTSNLDPNIKWFQVVGTERASFALTTDGRVFGWGTFRGKNGVIGFTHDPEDPDVQTKPRHIPELKYIKQLAAGKNHVLAYDESGQLYSWGCGEQGQLGRAYDPQNPRMGLKPEKVPGLEGHIYKVGCGSYHSFALTIDTKPRKNPTKYNPATTYVEYTTFAWGLNNFGQLGNPDAVAGAGAIQPTPIYAKGLKSYAIFDITGGDHYSLAKTFEGKVLTWGRVDNARTGLAATTFTKMNSIFEDGKPRILAIPTIISKLPFILSIASGPKHSFAVTVRGSNIYSWGSSYKGCTGHNTEDDTEIPRLIKYVTMHRKKVVFVGAGGTFSMLAVVAKRQGKSN